MRPYTRSPGVGGIELGFQRAGGYVTDLLCEWWAPAQAVLAERFERCVGDIWPDVATLGSLPDRTDVLTAGFPCTDLSQAGRMAGIGGAASGLVSHVFDLLGDAGAHGRMPAWLVIENVPNLLRLDQGRGMRHLVGQLESLGMRWAYRIVDSRFTGVPQRRRRVLLVASATDDPRPVLFSQDAGQRPANDYAEDAFGFYRLSRAIHLPSSGGSTLARERR
jgi:DNA (cytosine-5)-methyltransferase 1